MAAFDTLLVEMKGEAGGEQLDIGLKTSDQPDDGSETKLPLRLTSEWHTYTFPLEEFSGTDRRKLHLVAEFVFSGANAPTAYLRKVQYKLPTQEALTESFFQTIGVSRSGGIHTRDELEALWELAQLDPANEIVRSKLLNLWFGTPDAFMRGEAGGGQGFRAATGLNVEYHRIVMSNATKLGRSLAAALENR